MLQAELHAIARCVLFNFERGYSKQYIAILSDSQTANNVLSSSVSRSVSSNKEVVREQQGCSHVGPKKLRP